MQTEKNAGLLRLKAEAIYKMFQVKLGSPTKTHNEKTLHLLWVALTKHKAHWDVKSINLGNLQILQHFFAIRNRGETLWPTTDFIQAELTSRSAQWFRYN